MASLASKVQLLVLGEPASQFLNAGGKRPLDFSGWRGFAGGASREVSAGPSQGGLGETSPAELLSCLL